MLLITWLDCGKRVIRKILNAGSWASYAPYHGLELPNHGINFILCDCLPKLLPFLLTASGEEDNNEEMNVDDDPLTPVTTKKKTPKKKRAKKAMSQDRIDVSWQNSTLLMLIFFKLTLHACVELLWGNKSYLHFPFLNSFDARDGIFRLIWSIPCRLMPWLLKSPAHQQAWYWQHCIGNM